MRRYTDTYPKWSAISNKQMRQTGRKGEFPVITETTNSELASTRRTISGHRMDLTIY